jgi:hypothetical protein
MDKDVAQVATQVSAPAPPTKGDMLMRLVVPMVMGGIVGWAGGKGHPGGGFGASNDFFAQQRALRLQNAMMQRQYQNDAYKNALDAARTQHEISMPPINRVPAPVKAVENGENVMKSFNPSTMQWETMPGVTWSDKPTADQTSYDPDRGVIIDRSKGTFRTPVSEGPAPDSTTPGDTENGADSDSTSIPTGPPSRGSFISGGVPNTPPTGTAGPAPSPAAMRASKNKAGVPLGPKPTKPGSEINQLETSAAAAIREQHPDWNDFQVYAEVKRAGQKPDDTGDMSPKEYRRRQAALSTQLNSGFQQIERDRQKKLSALSKQASETNMGEDQLNAAKQQIEEDTADAKETMHQRIVDSASSQGIDLGEVPDYRAQFADSGANATPGGAAAPQTASGSRSKAPSGTKVVGMDVVQAWAARKNISVAAAQKQFKSRGYLIQAGVQ